ncbi:hypothetical protein [Terasakiella pusilla]|uniref:hypothetical protein n=1 Tax=Terasakiella pusilla TaxID=64973 RepID=UPI0004911A39|nr:hypothetical protein [Terasakiella pusilla]
MSTQRNSKRTKQYHPSHKMFEFDEGCHFIAESAVEEALDDFCVKPFYLNGNIIMLAPLDAVRMNLQPHLTLNHKNHIRGDFDPDLYASCIEVKQILKNTKPADVARLLRSKLRFQKDKCKVTSRYNPEYTPRGKRHYGANYAGHLYISMNKEAELSDRIEVLNVLKADIEAGNLVAEFQNINSQRYTFKVR